MRVRLDVPRDFSFRRTVNSHGWCDLAPFTVATDASAVATVVALPGGGARRIELREDKGVVLESPGAATAANRRAPIAAGGREAPLHLAGPPVYHPRRRRPRHRRAAA